jgi:heptosyltransferase I
MLSGIGDVVQALPVANALKRGALGRHITWIVRPAPAELLSGHPAADRVLVYDRKRGLGALLSLRRDLRGLRFDLAINFDLHLYAAPALWLVRSPRKLGFGRDRARDLVWLLATDRLPARAAEHTQDRLFEFLDYLGISPRPVDWCLNPRSDDCESARRLLPELADTPTVGLVVTSGRSPKDWPTERFAALARRLAAEPGARIVLLGGPSEHEAERARQVQARAGVETVWGLTGDLQLLVALISICDLVVAPDTGPMHIARALEKPVVSLFGHTDPRRYGPYGAYADLCVDRYNFDAPGRPTSQTGEGGRSGRMELIAVDEVQEKVVKGLRTYSSQGSGGTV